jgi:hypothetical protein
MRLLFSALFVGLFGSQACEQDIACGARGPDPRPGEIKLISWNIAELASAVKVYNRPVRSEDNFSDLRMYRACNGGCLRVARDRKLASKLARVFPS